METGNLEKKLWKLYKSIKVQQVPHYGEAAGFTLQQQEKKNLWIYSFTLA